MTNSTNITKLPLYIKNYKKNSHDIDNFATQLKKDLMYYFWSKCEWEIILTSWPPNNNFNDKKIDVFDQINLNWERFVEYIWANKHELKTKLKK